MSEANCLLRWTCDPRRKNSSCKTQKQVKGIQQYPSKTSLKQSFWQFRDADRLIGFWEEIFHGLLLISWPPFSLICPAPWKHWFLEFGYSADLIDFHFCERLYVYVHVMQFRFSNKTFHWCWCCEDTILPWPIINECLKCRNIKIFDIKSCRYNT